MTTSTHSPAPFLPPKGWRGLARLALEGLAAGVFVSLVLALAVFIVAAQAEAAPLARDPPAWSLRMRTAGRSNSRPPATRPRSPRRSSRPT